MNLRIALPVDDSLSAFLFGGQFDPNDGPIIGSRTGFGQGFWLLGIDSKAKISQRIEEFVSGYTYHSVYPSENTTGGEVISPATSSKRLSSPSSVAATMGTVPPQQEHCFLLRYCYFPMASISLDSSSSKCSLPAFRI